MKQKLLIEYKGLMMIFSMLCNFKEQENVIRAIHSITFLIRNSAMKIESDFHVFIAKDERQFLTRPRCVVEALPSRSTRNTGESVVRIHGSSSAADNGRNVGTTVFRESRKASWPLRGKDANVGTKSVTERDKNAATMKFEIWLQSTPEGRKWEMEPDNCDSKTMAERLWDPQDAITYKRAKAESGSSDLGTSSGKCSYIQTDSAPFDVVVKVDTGESIEAHRSVLCDSSEVFAAMLSSNFVEANQREVIVRDLNHITALFLVHYAYGCSWSFERRFATCPVLAESLCTDSSLDFDFLLELLASSDQFLLTDLKKQCVQLIMFRLTNKQAVDAYFAAVFYNAPVLRMYSLKYIFLGEIELECAYECLQRLLQSQESDRVFEDLKNIGSDCCAIESDY